MAATTRSPRPAPTAPARTARAPPRRRPPSRRTSRATRARRRGPGRGPSPGRRARARPGRRPGERCLRRTDRRSVRLRRRDGRPRGGREQRPRRAGPGLLEERPQAARRLPEGARLRLDRVRRGRAAGKDPTLLITDSPRSSRQHRVHAQGEHPQPDQGPLPRPPVGRLLPGELGAEGRHQRGHFHTACRMLSSLRTAPGRARCPPSSWRPRTTRGGATPDTVTVNVTGLPAGASPSAPCGPVTDRTASR